MSNGDALELAAVLAAAINAMHVETISGLIEVEAISADDGAAITTRITRTLANVASQSSLSEAQRLHLESIAEPLRAFAAALKEQSHRAERYP